MIRPLIIAPYLFCQNSAGIVEREFIKALIEFGINPTILCKDCIPDEKLEIIDACKVIKVKENKLFFYLEKILRHLKLRDLTLTPDYDRYSWNKYAIKAALRCLKSEKYDFVHSISFPSSSHLIGLEIKSKMNIPFVAQFYDPWVGNPIRDIKNAFLQKYDRRLEESVVVSSDVIIHTNNGIAKDWINRYGDRVRKKINVLPIINSLTLNAEFILPSNFTINHIGSLYSGRTARPFIEAVNIIKAKRPELLKLLEVNFVGGMTRSDSDQIEQYGLADVIHNIGRLSEKDCEVFYQKASMFLAIDCIYDYDFFYPSKILKYFSSQKPILGLISGDTILKSEMDASKNYSYHMSEHEDIANFIIGCLEGQIDLSSTDKEYYKRFLPCNVCDKYVNIVSELSNHL